MTQTEFMDKVDEIRKNSLELSAQVGIGGSGYNSGGTSPKYPNIPYLHYEEDFNKCFIECIKEEMIHLENKKTPIYGETINCYNYYVK